MINHQFLGGYAIFQTSTKVPGKDVDGLRAMPVCAASELDGLMSDVYRCSTDRKTDVREVQPTQMK